MAFISQEEITKIRESVNIIDVIGGYLPLTQKGKNYFCVCPFHDDHSPSMSISEDKQIYKCFSCGASGNVFTFVKEYEKTSFAEAVETVAKSVGIFLSQKIDSPADNKYKTEYEILKLSNKFYQNYLKTKEGLKAKKYLSDRGIDEEIISEFEIGLSPEGKNDLSNLLEQKRYDPKLTIELGLANLFDNKLVDVFTNRIMFPIHDYKGNVIAFTARIFNNEDLAKYVNSRETKIFKKSQILYNYHNAIKYVRQEKQLIVVEGNMDAIRLSANGIKNVVALMGTSLTKEQIDLMKKLRVDIVLCLDSDDAGLTAMNTNGELLTKVGIDTFIVKLSEAKDPDEYILKKGVESLQKLLKNPLKYFDYKLAYLRHNINVDNPDDLAKYINGVMAYLNTINDEILKELTINKINEEFNISIDILKKKLVAKETKEPLEQEEKFVRRGRKNKYEIAAQKILFFMMNDSNYIRMYQKGLGFLENAIYRSIANEIIYYYKINNDISIADFISFINDKESLSDKVMEIIGFSEESEINDDDFEKYIEVLKDEVIRGEINDIKKALKTELDTNKKVELLSRLTEIKKGSVRNE